MMRRRRVVFTNQTLGLRLGKRILSDGTAAGACGLFRTVRAVIGRRWFADAGAAVTEVLNEALKGSVEKGMVQISNEVHSDECLQVIGVVKDKEINTDVRAMKLEDVLAVIKSTARPVEITFDLPGETTVQEIETVNLLA